jgi:hypothetical protein
MREVRGPSQKSRNKMRHGAKCGTPVVVNAAFCPNLRRDAARGRPPQAQEVLQPWSHSKLGWLRM